jgi:hypothetical protein
MKSIIVIIVFVALFTTVLGNALISSGEPFINTDDTNSSAKEYGPKENVALDIVEPIGQPNEETVAPANSSEKGNRKMLSGMTSNGKPLAETRDAIRILFESMDGMTCDRKLKVVEDMVEKMLVLFDDKITEFSSVEALNETYCR